MTPLQRINAMPHGLERARAAQAYIREEREKMMDFCATLAALIEKAPNDAVRATLAVVQRLANCPIEPPVVAPQSGGGGPTNPPEPPK